jgi:hypothetical protein
MAPGIYARHARSCRSHDGARCNCEPTYQAHVWSNRDEKRIRKEFPSLAAAKAWREDARVALREGRMQAPSSTTLREAATEWLEGAKAGRLPAQATPTSREQFALTSERCGLECSTSSAASVCLTFIVGNSSGS